MPSSYSHLVDMWEDSDYSYQQASFVQNMSILRRLVYGPFNLTHISCDDHTLINRVGTLSKQY